MNRTGLENAPLLPCSTNSRQLLASISYVLLVLPMHKEWVCVNVYGRYCQLESDLARTPLARRKCVTIERGHVVRRCVHACMDSFVDAGTGCFISCFKSLWHFPSFVGSQSSEIQSCAAHQMIQTFNLLPNVCPVVAQAQAIDRRRREEEDLMKK